VQQGLRAVNQAMGRVIRHRWDYGAVLLADERFGSQQNLRNMSRWLRDQVVTHGSFGSAIASLTKFFKVGWWRAGPAACGNITSSSCWRVAG
jgi:regulator of telomere elongation helicase 1